MFKIKWKHIFGISLTVKKIKNPVWVKKIKNPHVPYQVFMF
jgi:hypothetical protein